MEKYDIIVIGGGPAGLSAAIYGLRAGKKVLVLEGKALGGQIINAPDIQNYPGVMNISGADLSMNMYHQVENFGGEVKFEHATNIILDGEEKVVKTDDNEYRTNFVILATGAENRKLGLPREQDLTGKGISYCAICDGNFYKDKDVAVIGGGNTALEDAVYLSSLANKVYLIHRRDKFRGDDANVAKVRNCKNVELVLKANATELLGKKSVEGLKVKFDDETERTLRVDGVFFAVGYVPQNAEFANLVELDADGYVKTADGVHTNIPGIYVAGDARAKDLKQLTTAVSDGSIAATTAIKEME